MPRRLPLLLPLTFLVGCGAASPAPASPPPTGAPGPSAEAAPSSLSLHQDPPGRGSSKASDSAAPEAPRANAPEKDKKAIGRAAVSSTDAPLQSAITQDQVMYQVGKSSEMFNKCYSLGAGASKSWRAKVTVKATVGPSGNVGSAEVLSSTAKNPKVDACVVESFKKLHFPRAEGSGTTTFTFPLSFDGVEQVQ